MPPAKGDKNRGRKQATEVGHCPSTSPSEPVFGQMKDCQGARRFSVRGLDRCRGQWLLDAAVHNLRKLHRDSVRRMEKARERAAKREQKAA